MKNLVAAVCLSSLSLANAFASPATDAAALHFQAIGAGDTALLMRGYGDAPRLNWVGGPLDGAYNGTADIQAVWAKFAKAAGPLKVSVDKMEEAANPKGSTVTANVLFEGKQPIKVRYVLTMRGNMIVDETWQIDPKLAVAAGY